MNKGKMISAALAIAIGATLAACNYTSTPQAAKPKFTPTTEVITAAPYLITRVQIEEAFFLVRIRDLETGVVCYKFGERIGYSSDVMSCEQDINAQASVQTDASYTTLDQEQIEWLFNGNNSQK